MVGLEVQPRGGGGAEGGGTEREREDGSSSDETYTLIRMKKRPLNSVEETQKRSESNESVCGGRQSGRATRAGSLAGCVSYFKL